MRVYHGDPEKLAAPDPELTSDLLEFVGDRYGLRTDRPRDLGGSFNLNVRLDGHVLRVYGPWVNGKRVDELQRIRRILKSRDVLIPDLRPAIDGSHWCRWGDSVLEVEQYVAGQRMDSTDRLRVGVRALGRLHALMEDLTVEVPPPIANHLPQALALDATLDATAVVRSWGPTPQEEHYAQAAEALARLLPVVDLPTQLVHGDFWDNNVRFGTDSVVAVLDFDFAGIRPRVDDLALPLNYAVQGGLPWSMVNTLIEAYDAGCARPLSAAERRALPYAMARMALSFLQYLVLPQDESRMRMLRREFNEKRGPACEWWLDAIQEGRVWDGMFVGV